MKRSANLIRRSCKTFGIAILVASAATSQSKDPSGNISEPHLLAAIADSTHRSNVPAIQWLCQEFLPKQPQWPTGLKPSDAFSISLSATELKIQKTKIEIPAGSVAIGAMSFSTDRGEPQIRFTCEENGREQWVIPDDFELPRKWHSLLHSLHADELETPRTISIPVIVGHLAGGILDNDPRAPLVRLGPSLCGDVTWLAWQSSSNTHVCGRSGGGLMLPLTLTWFAITDGIGQLSGLSLRAFAARDADRTEAARQMGRGDRELEAKTLCALLHAEDQVRLPAIESLVRHGAADQLPAIIYAAGKQNPLATIAARDAVFRLWPTATFSERSEARAALKQSQVGVLQELDFENLAEHRSQHLGTLFTQKSDSAQPVGDARQRTIIILICSALGLIGLWLRERTLPQANASP